MTKPARADRQAQAVCASKTATPKALDEDNSVPAPTSAVVQSSRRRFLMNTVVSVASLAPASSIASPSIAGRQVTRDPIFDVIGRVDKHWDALGESIKREPRDLNSEAHAVWEKEQDKISAPLEAAVQQLFETVASTRPGLVAQLGRILRFLADHGIDVEDAPEIVFLQKLAIAIPQLV